jgi:hypothetical protein
MLRRIISVCAVFCFLIRFALADCLYDPTYPLVTTTSLFAAADLSGLGANLCKVSTGGSSGVFTTTTVTGGALFGSLVFKVVTTGFTPSAGQNLSVWLLRSLDGTNYEQNYASLPCSSTQPPVQRAPDFVIALPPVALAANDLIWSYPGQLPPAGSPGSTFKVVLWNNGTTALSAQNHTVTLGAYAVKCQ